MKKVFVVLAVLLVLYSMTDVARGIVRRLGRNAINGTDSRRGDTNVDMGVIRKLADLNTVDFIKYFGYPCDSHEVTTKDGYILTLHHIPHGKKGPVEHEQPVVFLQHGILACSQDWFTMGPDKALGFLLADAGYDVWVGNSRGNIYSRSHITLDPDKDPAFWNFTFHEIAYYDLSAMIDYALEYSRQPKLFYIGHSQGTLISFVLLSEKPEYNSKFQSIYALAPIAYLSHVKGTFLRVLQKFRNLAEIGDIFGIKELSNINPLFKFLSRRVCTAEILKQLCLKELFEVTGYDVPQFNVSLLPIIAANFPAGSSFKQLKHYIQVAQSGELKHYDYGFERNDLYYGSYFPPSYDLCKVTSPIHLIYSENDYLSSPKDVKRLFLELPEGNKYMWKVPNRKWNHIDYIFGKDAKYLVYDLIMEDMLKRQKSD